MPPVLDGAHDVRPRAVKQLHADFDKGLPAGKLVQEGKGRFPVREIAGDDDVSAHLSVLL